MSIHERFENIPEIDLGDPLPVRRGRVQRKVLLLRLRSLRRRRHQPPCRMPLAPWIVAACMILILALVLLASSSAPIAGSW